MPFFSSVARRRRYHETDGYQVAEQYQRAQDDADNRVRGAVDFVGAGLSYDIDEAAGAASELSRSAVGDSSVISAFGDTEWQTSLRGQNQRINAQLGRPAVRSLRCRVSPADPRPRGAGALSEAPPS